MTKCVYVCFNRILVRVTKRKAENAEDLKQRLAPLLQASPPSLQLRLHFSLASW